MNSATAIRQAALCALCIACSLTLGGCAAVVTAAATHSAAIAAVIEVAPVAIAATAIAATGVAGSVQSTQEKHEPGTLGAYLAQAASEADALVQTAIRNQQETSVVAGLKVRAALARARVAYREDLGLRMNTLKGPQKSFVAEMAEATASLGSGDPAIVIAAGDKARSLGDKLQVPANMPVVRTFGPVYAFSFLPFQTIVIRGSFPDRYEEGALPELRIGDKRFKAFAYDKDGLEFSVATSALANPDDPARISWNRAEISIPWQRPVFHDALRDDFPNQVFIGLLPDSPGRATFEQRSTRLRKEEKTLESVTKPVAGSTTESLCLTLSAQELSEGWKIVPGASTLAPPAKSSGVETERSACWEVAADPGEQAAWKASTRIWREVRDSTTATQNFDLRWGEFRSLTHPAGQWKLKYSILDRPVTEVTRTDLSNPFIRVTSDQERITVRVYPF